MATTMISCRIDSDKLEKLKALYPNAGLTQAIDCAIDFRLSGGKTGAGLSDSRKITTEEMEGIRRLKSEAAKAWRERNPDKVRAYTKKHSKLHPLDPVKRKAARERYWLKKLRKEGGTDEE